ncbi:MAG: 23S rRNA (uracil(1939)-C(5))-methyltransferase RlmD [Bacteroidales bacterium]
MGRKKKKDLPLLEKVTITGVAAEGKALARVNDKVLFVPFAAPGDVVDVKVKRSRRNYMEGSIAFVHAYSPDRTEPFCSHFGVCGGCKWQHLPYKKQLAFKQSQVTDSLERIGKLDLSGVEVLPVAASELTTFYRNKMEYTFSDRRWLSKEDIDSGREIRDMEALGFHIPGFYDKVLDIKKCWLQPEPSNEIRLAVKQFAVENGLSFFDLRTNRGFLRNLIIRNSLQGELMVVMVFGRDDPGQIEQVMSFIHRRFPGLRSLAYMINSKQNSSISDLQPVIYAGREALEERMEDLRFMVGPKSFFQTNSIQALRLYGIVRNFAELTGREVLYDLYTGTGTIACFLAAGANKVVGIEYVDEAVDHALRNAGLNRIENAIFLAGDMADVFNEELMKQQGFPDVIVTDPPRAGMHPTVVDKIILSGADRIVYVSCNPATQARDVELLGGHYRVERIQAVDMFPHTHHVENVLLLKRK